MDQATLVDADIDAGRKLVEALDKNTDFKVTAALWVFREDSDEYRLVLASPFVDKRGSNLAYAKIARALLSNDLYDRLPLLRIEAATTSDPLVNAVRRLIRTGKRRFVDVRLRNNLMNGILIPDTYVYRAA